MKTKDEIVKRFGETRDSSERWAPALARRINIFTNHYLPKEAVKTLMIPQETPGLAWPYL